MPFLFDLPDGVHWTDSNDNVENIFDYGSEYDWSGVIKECLNCKPWEVDGQW